MKKHETLPNEPQENPAPNQRPEIIRPIDPNVPASPREDDENVPQELPPLKSPDEEPPMNPNTY